MLSQVDSLFESTFCVMMKIHPSWSQVSPPWIRTSSRSHKEFPDECGKGSTDECGKGSLEMCGKVLWKKVICRTFEFGKGIWQRFYREVPTDPIFLFAIAECPQWQFISGLLNQTCDSLPGVSCLHHFAFLTSSLLANSNTLDQLSL